MKKKNSTKEVILLIILCVLLILFYVSKVPLQNKIDELALERDNTNAQIATLQPTIVEMNKMQVEVDKANEKYNGKPVSIPDYNNINNVIAEMSLIFDGDSSYTINFTDPSFDERIATRRLKITFSCYDYEEMINKLITINSSNNRYRISDLSINEGSNDLYSVNLSVITREYSSND